MFTTTPSAVNHYDAVPYQGLPVKQSHPAWIAAVSQLLSVQAPPPQACRVLELGCCDGGNLIAMAAQLPDSTFTGVDYSAVQIEAGQRTIAQLQLKNVQLKTQSILDMTTEWGQFDYIIAHGVLSWVPADVQEKLFEVTKMLLAPQGIAYISFNTYPGWHLKTIARDLMQYHASRFDDPVKKVQEARLILDFVAQFSAGVQTEAYKMFLKGESEMLRTMPDYYVAHDHMEENCEPFYFHEFADRAARYGLEFFAEASVGMMVPGNFGPVAARAMTGLASNLIEREQFMDFLWNRSFRQSLLRHQGAPQANYNMQPQSIQSLFITGTLNSTASLDLRPDQNVTFTSFTNFPITTSNPLVKAALSRLADSFPAEIQFETLLQQARSALTSAQIGVNSLDQDRTDLGAALIQLLVNSDLISLSKLPGEFAKSVSVKPVASPLAQLQARTSSTVATRRHESAVLEPLNQQVLLMLDGSLTARHLARLLGKTEPEILAALNSLLRHALLMS